MLPNFRLRSSYNRSRWLLTRLRHRRFFVSWPSSTSAMWLGSIAPDSGIFLKWWHFQIIQYFTIFVLKPIVFGDHFKTPPFIWVHFVLPVCLLISMLIGISKQSNAVSARIRHANFTRNWWSIFNSRFTIGVNHYGSPLTMNSDTSMQILSDKVFHWGSPGFIMFFC